MAAGHCGQAQQASLHLHCSEVLVKSLKCHSLTLPQAEPEALAVPVVLRVPAGPAPGPGRRRRRGRPSPASATTSSSGGWSGGRRRATAAGSIMHAMHLPGFCQCHFKLPRVLVLVGPALRLALIDKVSEVAILVSRSQCLSVFAPTRTWRNKSRRRPGRAWALGPRNLEDSNLLPSSNPHFGT